MTLLIALKWLFEGKESVVVSSDSKVTFGPVSYETRKVYPIALKEGGGVRPARDSRRRWGCLPDQAKLPGM